MKIVTFVDEKSETNTYLLIEDNNKHVIIIDPVDGHKVIEYLEKNLLSADIIVLTHEHIDHIMGVKELKLYYEEIELIASKNCSIRIQSPIKNMAKTYETYLLFKNKEISSKYTGIDKEFYLKPADIEFIDEYEFLWEENKIRIRETPGHSKGSCCILINNNILFSGDTLLYDYDVILRLPGGSKKDYERYTIPYLLSLSSDILVYPGHGRSFVLSERLGNLLER